MKYAMAAFDFEVINLC